MATKKMTGLTGLKVCKTPAHTLGLLYGKVLRALAKLPESSSYRRYTEEIVAHRAAIVDQNGSSPEDIERKINCGQVEELIIQAENELRLARNLLFSKPWEPLIAHPEPNQWTWPPTVK